MARFARARSAYRSTRGYRKGKTYAGYSKGAVGFGRGKIAVSIPLEFLGGLAIGALTDLDNKVPATIKLAAATVPIRGPGINQVKNFAQGMVLGDVIQSMTGISLLNTGAGTANRSWGSQ